MKVRKTYKFFRANFQYNTKKRNWHLFINTTSGLSVIKPKDPMLYISVFLLGSDCCRTPFLNLLTCVFFCYAACLGTRRGHFEHLVHHYRLNY